MIFGYTMDLFQIQQQPLIVPLIQQLPQLALIW